MMRQTKYFPSLLLYLFCYSYYQLAENFLQASEGPLQLLYLADLFGHLFIPITSQVALHLVVTVGWCWVRHGGQVLFLIFKSS